MTTVMTPEEYSRRTGADLAGLRAAIDEARNDAITKDTMNRESLTSRNITPETEGFMREFLRRASRQ